MKKFRSKSQDRSRSKQRVKETPGFLRSQSRERPPYHHEAQAEYYDDDPRASRSRGTHQSRSSRQSTRKSFIQKNASKDSSEPQVELSTTEGAPGVIKIFGDSIVSGAEYKSVLACAKSTANELVKEALERYGIPRRDSTQFVLCEVIGQFVPSDERFQENLDECTVWQTKYRRIIADNEQPLMMHSFWKPTKGYVRRLELCPRNLVEGVSSLDTGTSAFNANARRMLITKARGGNAQDDITQHEHGNLPNHPSGYRSANTQFLDADENSDDNEVFWENPVDNYKRANFVRDFNHTNQNKPNMNYASLPRAQVSRVHVPRTQSCENLDSYRDVSEMSNRSHQHMFTQNEDAEAKSRPPTDKPYLLNLNGFNRSLDYVLYIIDNRKTTIVGPNGQLRSSFGSIRLHAPDILFEHCWMYLDTPVSTDSPQITRRYTIVIQPHPQARVLVNNVQIHAKTRVKSGDIMTFGKHYVFLLKMPPFYNKSVPHGPTAGNGVEYRTSDHRTQMHKQKTERQVKCDAFIAWQQSRCKQFWNDRNRYKLPYSRDHEVELVHFITSLEFSGYCDFPLMPAYLFIMSLEHSSLHFEFGSTAAFLDMIHLRVQEGVWECSKRIARNHLDPPNYQLQETIEDVLSDLEPVFFWINNMVEFIGILTDKHRNMFLDPYLLNDRNQQEGLKRSDVAKEGSVLGRLEDLVRSLFQQSVYYITKTLYTVLPAVLESNPFENSNSLYHHSSGMTVQSVVHIFQTTYEFLRRHDTHPLMTLQLFAYLAFFTNTSLFNSLMVKDAGKIYFNWAKGVQIRGNLDVLEDWSHQRGLLDVFKAHFSKINALADLLATVKVHILQGSCDSLANVFPGLNALQLNHVLCGYDVGHGVRKPRFYVPLESDKLELMENFNNHPPLMLPVEGFILNLRHPISDASFHDVIKVAKTRFSSNQDNATSTIRNIGSPPPYRRPWIPGQSSSPDHLSDSLQGSEDNATLQASVDIEASNPNFVEYLKHRDKKLKDCRTIDTERSPYQKTKQDLNSHYKPQNDTNDTNQDMTLQSDVRRDTSTAFRSFQAVQRKTTKFVQESPTLVVSSNTISYSSETPLSDRCPQPILNGRNTCDPHENSNMSISRENKTERTDLTIQQPLKKTEKIFISLEDTIPCDPLLDKQNTTTCIQILENIPPKSGHDGKSSVKNQLQNYPNTQPMKSEIENKRKNPPPSENAIKQSFQTVLSRKPTYPKGPNLTVEPFRSSPDEKPGDTSVDTGSVENEVVFPETEHASIKTPNYKAIKVVDEKEKNIESTTIAIDRHTAVAQETNGSDTQVECEISNAPKDRDVIARASRSSSLSRYQESPYVYVTPDDTKSDKSSSGLRVLSLTTDDQVTNPQWDDIPQDGIGESEKDCRMHDIVMTKSEKIGSDLDEDDDVFLIELERTESGIGLGLIDGLYTALGEPGLYVRTLVPGSAADKNGRLRLGDRILAVNDSSIVGVDYHSSMEMIRKAGKLLRLLVAKSDKGTTMKITASSC